MLSSRRTPSSCKLTALSKLSGCGSAAAINRAEISQYFSGALASQLLNRSHFSFRGDGLCATAAGRTAHGRCSAASPAWLVLGDPARPTCGILFVTVPADQLQFAQSPTALPCSDWSTARCSLSCSAKAIGRSSYRNATWHQPDCGRGPLAFR